MNKLWLLLLLLFIPLFASADNVSIFIQADAVSCSNLNQTAVNLSCEQYASDTWEFKGYSGDSELNLNRMFFYLIDRSISSNTTLLNGVTNPSAIYIDDERFYNYSFIFSKLKSETGFGQFSTAYNDITLSDANSPVYFISYAGYSDGPNPSHYVAGDYSSGTFFNFSASDVWYNQTQNDTILFANSNSIRSITHNPGAGSGYQEQLMSIMLWNRTKFSSMESYVYCHASNSCWNYVSSIFNFTAPSVAVSLENPNTGIEYYASNVSLNFSISTLPVGIPDIDVANISYYIFNNTELYSTYTEDNPGTGTFTSYYVTDINSSGNFSWKGGYCNTIGLCENTSETRYFNVTTDRYIRFNVLDYFGNILTNVRLLVSDIFDTYSNQHLEPMDSFVLNNTYQYQINFSYWDYGFRHVANNTLMNVSGNDTEVNITMTPNQLTLFFYDELNNSASVNGTVAHGEGNTSQMMIFSNSSIVIVQTELEVGEVKVHFNKTQEVNWTQYYEYYNDQTDHIYEEIMVLDNPDQLVYFKVQELSGYPIENAQVHLRYANVWDSNTWFDMRVVGQRLTDTDGMTLFWLKDRGYVSYIVTADGYTPVSDHILPADMSSNTPDTAFTITMEESDSGFDSGVWYGIPKYINDKSENLSFSIVSCDALTVGYLTEYKEDLGYTYSNIQESSSTPCLYSATLISDDDYSSSTFDDIELGIYYNNEEFTTVTILYQESRSTLEIPDFDNEDIAFALFIGLIIFSAFLGVMNSSASAGFRIFMFGSLGLALLNARFMWLTVVSALVLIIEGGIVKLFRD